MLLLTTLKQKLYAIIFASLVVRIIGFFLLPNGPRVALAPDEGGYAEIVRLVASGEPSTSFGGLYVISRSLVLPAVVLNNLGVDPLSAVRITASMYGALSLILVTFLVLKSLDRYFNLEELTQKRNNLIVGILSIFAFLPSHLLWSMLGLRESPMEFWVLCALGSIYAAFYLQEKISPLIIFSLIISVVLLFNTRPQVGWLLGVTILIYLVLRVRNRIASALIPLTIIALGLGYTSVALSFHTHDVFTLVAADGTAADGTAADGTAADGTACEKNDQKIIVQKVDYVCKKTGEKKEFVGLQNPGEVLVGQTEAIPLHHELNRVDAASAIPTIGCPNSGKTRFDRYVCMVWRAPYMSATFLFRPLIGVDITSTSSLLAAIENMAWLGAFLFFIVLLVRKRRLAFFGALAPSLIFFTLYCLSAGSYEGNMGTAFRHKSLILWVVLLLLASIIAEEKKPN